MTRSTLTKEVQFDAGHRVPAHTSKCQHPHGHRYRVVVNAEGPVPESGMVVDFGILKSWMVEEIHDRFDHAMIAHALDTNLIDAMQANGWRCEILPYPPTAENLAHFAYHLLAARAASFQLPGQDPNDGLQIRSVTVWETPTSSATYTWETYTWETQ